MAKPDLEAPIQVVASLNEKEPIRVLHVDDEPALLKIAKECLRMEGPFEVETASSVDEALNKLEEKEYDAVVSDYQMPGKDGLEFLKELRESGNSIAFILFTGKGREEVAIRALNLGADRYLNKVGPPDAVYGELAHSVQEAVDKRRILAKAAYQAMLMENVKDAIVGTDEHFTITSWNKAAEEMYGWKAEEVIWKPGSEILRTEFIGTERAEATQTLKETGRFRGDAVQYRKDGQSVHVESTVIAIRNRNGAITGYVSVNRDVTERLNMEGKLKETNKKLEMILQQASEGIGVVDASEKFVFVNKAFADVLGCQENELIGMNVRDFVDEQGFREVMKQAELRSKGSSSQYDLVMYRRNGEQRLIRVSASPLLNEDGSFFGALAVISDLTERKKAEDALWKSESKYRALLENLPQKIFLKDRDLVYVSCNENYARDLKIKSNEVTGKTDYDFYPKELAEKYRADDKRIMESGKIEDIEEEYVQNGQEVFVHTVKVPVKNENGNVVGVLGIFWGITERKKAEEELLYDASLLQNVSDAVIATDRNFGIKSWNKAAEKIYGWKEKEVIGKRVKDVTKTEYVHGNEEEARKQFLKEGHWESEVIQKHKNGNTINILASVSLIKNKDGDSTGAVAVNRDITECKKAKESVRASEERYRSYIEVTGQLGWTTNANGEVEEDIPAWRKYTGQSYEEAKGWRWTKALHPDDLEHTVQAWEKAVAEKNSYEVEYRMRRYDGVYRYFMARGVPVLEKDGKIREWVGTCIDITERRKAEEELRRFSTAVRTSLDGIITGDLNGNITDVNDAVLRMYGDSNKGDLVGKNVLDFVVESDRTRALQDSMESIKTGQGKTIEYRALAKNGTEIPIEITTALTRDEQGEPIGFVDIVRNISERKNAELELQMSERKYRELADQLPVIVYEIDCKGKFTFVNEKGHELTGYSHEDIEKGLNILQVVVDEDQGKAEARIQRTLSGEKIDYSEYTVLKKDGSTFPAIACVGTIVREGKTIGLRGTVIDITDRKKAEEALKDSEEKFRNLAEQSPNMIFINQKGRVVYANRKAEDSMGYTREEFCSPDFNFLDLIAEESKGSVKSAFSKHTSGDDVAPYEYKLITKEGRAIEAIINSKLIKYGGEPAILGVVTDISDRKKAERMTLASQQNFKALFMGNPEAAAHLASDFHILDVNPRFEELFGYSLAEAKGRHINDVIVPKMKMEEAETLDKNAVEGYVYCNTVRKRKDGSLVPVAVSAATIMVEGKLAGCIAMYKDISELKNAEKKLETMNEKLRVVGVLTRHDVRNKLSAITGNIYLNKKKSAVNPDVLRSYENMESACEQIGRIFDFAKDYEMLGVEELSYVDVEDVVQKAVSLFSDLNEVKVVNECHGLTVLADSLLRQLFYNLIDNSLKYGKKITTMRVHCERIGKDELRLIYEDDGVGIPSAEKPKLFREGYSTGGSTGYGLYLIGKMMEVYGWTIQEKGEPGKGAQFVMTIPRTNSNGKQNYQIA